MSEAQDQPQEATRLELNGPIPNVHLKTTHGNFDLHDYAEGKWIILFSHPADFTPVCTTEFMAFAKLEQEFKDRNVALIGNSIDSIYSHIAWVRSIKQNFDVDINFPIIADLDMKVAKAFNMIHEASATTEAVRTVFFIDPDRKLRAMIYYPLNVGRNFDEIVRVIDALQTADEHKVACPADWRPGDKVIVPPPATTEAAAARMESDFEVTDWYFSKKSI